MTDPAIAVRDVLVTREGRATLSVANLEVLKGETLGIIGPNGAGKSTLLRVLALLQRPERGEVDFAGERVNLYANLLPYRRRLAIVFQDPLLMNSSVYSNVAVGLGFRGVPGREAEARVGHWLERLGVARLHDRAARTLSGGEAQRVSLARALVLEPEVLLLDEPFSALDAPTRTSLIDDLGRILAESPVTTVYVTHDRGEAIALSDRLAVMVAGEVRQLDAPQRVFAAPVDEEVAAFVGVETIIPGRVKAQQAGLALVDVDGALLQAVCDYPVGQSVLVLLRPEDVTLAVADGAGRPTSARNSLRGTVSRVTSFGALARVVVDCGFPVVVSITHQSYLDLNLAPGTAVQASFKATAVHVIRHD
ncbi:MAG: ABC transporter ATP-binding protein [Chloroflexota bacterium]